ncbi:MAG TPA: hypothetical protein VHO02_00980 [Fibrobacteria bacterium]|nr:hypothetical protein [Fibrobacteria bacterium]
MRRRRHRAPALVGDGISFEEVLTVVTVLLLLRVVFMVPMVNLDKAKTESAQRDAYWAREAAYVLSAKDDPAALKPYRAAFGIREMRGNLSGRDGIVYVEAAAPDSSLLVIRHAPDERAFVAMRVESGGQSRSFRHGRLLWSQEEGEWFVASDTIDYGSDPASLRMEKAFREKTRKERGY